jgi:hypothetical protein
MINKRIGKSKKFNIGLKTDKARLAYLMIYPHVDVEGRIIGDVDEIKVDCFPFLKSMTPARIREAIDELATVGLLISYEIGGIKYLQFINFEEFQPGLRKDREADSTIPPPSISGPLPDNSGLTPENAGPAPATSPLNLNLKSKFNLNLNSPCPGKTPDEVDIRLTQLLIDLMLENNPESSIIRHLTPKRQWEWINSCRLLREQDRRTPEQIEVLIRWTQADSFWKANIHSIPKLRKQWDQLWMKAKRGGKFSGIKEWLAEEEAKDGKK